MNVLSAPTARRATPLRFPPKRVLLALGVLALLFVVVLGLKLQSVRGPVNVDRRAAAHIVDIPAEHNRDADIDYRDILGLSSPGPVTLSLLVLAAWAVKRRDIVGLFVAVGGPVAAVLLAEEVLKPLVERRATNGALSYPSGHVTAGAAIATAVLLVLFRYAGLRWTLAWSPFAVFGSIALAVSVVAVGWHYATDSIAGIALGAGTVCVLAAFGDAVTPARSSSMPDR